MHQRARSNMGGYTLGSSEEKEEIYYQFKG